MLVVPSKQTPTAHSHLRISRRFVSLSSIADFINKCDSHNNCGDISAALFRFPTLEGDFGVERNKICRHLNIYDNLRAAICMKTFHRTKTHIAQLLKNLQSRDSSMLF